MRFSRVMIALAFVATTALTGNALADYVIKQGDGSTISTIFSFVCQSTKLCPAEVLIDSSGAEKATSGNPLRTDPTGTTTQPVSFASTPTVNLGTLNGVALDASVQSILTTLGLVAASPAANTIGDRLKTINTTLGSPFQAGGSIGNSSFAIAGTLPAFAATPTFNLGTLNGAALATKQPALGTAGTPSSDVITVQGAASMTPVKVDGSSVTQPISAASLPLPALAASSTKQSDGTQKTQVVDGSGNVQPAGDTAARAIFNKPTDGTNSATFKASGTNAATTDTAFVADPRPNSAATVSGSSTNPTSTLTLTSSTTAYTAGQLIANNATAGSVVVPSFAIVNSAGGAIISRLRLSSNDTTSTAWAGFTIQIDLWIAAPTFTNGDRGTWLPATGAASHLATFSCAFPTPVWGDGLGTECAPSTGNAATLKLGSGTSVFWTAKAIGGSGVTGASKTLTITAELAN